MAINQFPLASNHEARIAGLVARYRMPAVADGRNFAEAGVLLTYTTDTSELWPRTAQYAATFELSLALGAPLLAPQTPVKVHGFKAQIDETDWLIVKVSHSVGDGGYTTKLERAGTEAESS